jgi:hypothetical protein
MYRSTAGEVKWSKCRVFGGGEPIRGLIRWGPLNVLDLLFTPIPQFLPEIGIECHLAGKRNTRPTCDILKCGSITG